MIFMRVLVIKNKQVTISVGKNYLRLQINLRHTIDLIVLLINTDLVNMRIIRVQPNVTFTKEYIKKYQGKSFIKIPEVSE